jgi:small GTP-binding protein
MFQNEDLEEEEGNEIKVILVGEPGTGKTSLINVSIGQEFKEESNSTLSSTFVPKKITKDGKEYNVNIWDTAGQEKYRSLTKIFIKDSKIVIFVYAIDNKDSYEGIKSYWVGTIKEALGEDPVLGLVGNKCDLFMNEQVKESEAKEFAQEKGMEFQLATAKENPKGFNQFLNKLVDIYLDKSGIAPKRKSIFINKDDTTGVEEKKGCCKK